MCDVPKYKTSNLSNFQIKILNYLKDLHQWGWYIRRMYHGDNKIHYLLTRTVFNIDALPYSINTYQYEISFDGKKLKNGKYLYIFNDDFYSTEDEVIEEMKRMGIK